jgi:hypothetical protein
MSALGTAKKMDRPFQEAQKDLPIENGDLP